METLCGNAWCVLRWKVCRRGCSGRLAKLQDHGVLAEPSVSESIVYAGTWLPYPMKPFELVLSVRWVDLVQAR